MKYMKTRRLFRHTNTSRKSRKQQGSMAAFECEVSMKLLEMLLMVKLYHWKTHSYATHKATDELYDKLNGHIDQFIEVLLGKTGNRIDLTKHRSIRLLDLQSPKQLKREVEICKSYLVGLDRQRALQTMSNSDLFNIRDEILGDLNQFLYLLTFK